MNKVLAFVIVAFLGISGGIAFGALEDNYQPSQAEYVYNTAINGIVLITTVVDEVENKNGMGTGFFIDDNLIMTNAHVVNEAKSIEVYMPESSINYKAELISSSPAMDTALLKIVDWDTFRKEQSHRVLQFAANEPRVGQTIYTLGHPNGIPWSISEGIISGLHRPADGPKEFIQVDAKIYQGNSGGPLLNVKGEVVGMNTLIIETTGGSYGFAIDKTYLKKTMYDLMKYGKVQFVRAGMALKLTEDRKYIAVEEVMTGGAAESCGIVKDDILKSVNTANGKLDLNMGDVGRVVMKFNSLNMDQTKINFTIERNDVIITKDCNLTLKDS